MKPKVYWIEKYIFESYDKQSGLDVISNTTEILKLNVKPKVLWFIRHVFSKVPQNELEEGEILSDDDSDAEVVNLNHEKMISFACEEAKKATNVYENPTEYSSAVQYSHNSGVNYRQSYSNDRRSHQFQNTQHSKYHHWERKSDWNITLQSDKRNRRSFNQH